MRKILYLAGHVCFIYLLILSVLYFQERTIYDDAAQYILTIINQNGELYNNMGAFLIGSRYSGDILLFIPWLFVILGASLKSVLLSYSVSAVIIPYLVYVLIAHYYKQPLLAFAFVLSLVLCNRYTFYFIVTEAHTVIMYAFWFTALLSYKSKIHWLRLAGLFLLCLAGMFCYPTFIFLYLFGIFYYARNIRESPKREKITVFAVSFILICMSIISILTFKSSAQGIRFSAALNFITYIREFFILPSFHFLWVHSFESSMTYLPFWIIVIIVLLTCIFMKKFYMPIILLVFIAFYMFVNNAVWAIGVSALMMEKTLLPLSFFSSLALCYSFEQIMVKQRKTIAIIISFSVVILFFVKIRDVSLGSKNAVKHLEKVKYIYKHYTSEEHTKVIVPIKKAKQYGIATWAMSYETLLKSTIDGEKT